MWAAVACAFLGASAASAGPWEAFNLAPSSRTLRPVALLHRHASNYDFVNAGDPASEAAHALQASPSSGTNVETVLRRYSAGSPGAAFSYLLRVAPGAPFWLRIDETASSDVTTKRYRVRLDGVDFFLRERVNHAGWGVSSGGVASYLLEVPASFAADGEVRVEFVRLDPEVASDPSIAAVWTLGEAPLPDPARGGLVTGIDALASGGGATFDASSSTTAAPFAILDFGRSVAGTLSFDFTAAAPRSLKITYSNSALYAGLAGDAQTDLEPVQDESQNLVLDGAGTWTSDTLRGGFRYVTLMATGPGALEISDPRVAFSAVPDMPDPSDYAGYWYSDDDLLNAIWYAGAYTAQLCTIDADTARGGSSAYGSWANRANLGTSGSVFVDGGKRDRHVWDGDLAVAFPTAWLAYADAASTRRALEVVYDGQLPSGALRDTSAWSPGVYGDIYHAWGVYSFADYVRYTADTGFRDARWTQHVDAVEHLIGRLSGGLLSTGGGTWFGQADPQSASGSLAAHLALLRSAEIAEHRGDAVLADDWRSAAQTIADAVDAQLWNPDAGAYSQSPSRPARLSTLGNALALLARIGGPARETAVLAALDAQMRNPLGYTAVDAPDGTQIPYINSPFVGSWLLRGLFAAGADATALDFARAAWGAQLESPVGNGSTFWEAAAPDGYSLHDAYESYGHVWATGPTAALTEFVLGVQPLTPGYATYRVAPRPGDLTRVEGRVPLPGGASLAVAYTTDGAERFDGVLDSSAAPGATGEFGIPTFGGAIGFVRVNGAVAWDGSFHATPGVEGAEERSGVLFLTGIAPGSYTVEARTGAPVPSLGAGGIALLAGAVLASALARQVARARRCR